DRGNSVWGDGSFIYTCGHTWSFGDGSDDLLLVKWDPDGNQVWNRTWDGSSSWGGSSSDYGKSVWGDGSYLYTCGYTESSGAGSADLLLVKWDTTMIESSDDGSTTTNADIPGYDPILIILALTVELMVTVFVLMLLKNRGFKVKI
ncbi:MAG: hypothetical protein ACTSWN_05480, partial [Promethearchaeota archaeon]